MNMTADIGDTIAPTSTQLDAIDLIGGPVTARIIDAKVTKGAEQPVSITLDAFDRPWKPGKNVRRVLVRAWGGKASAYVGRSVTIYRDPEVKWAGKKVGGIRISHMSDIDGPVDVPQMEGSNASSTTVQPLRDVPRAGPTPTDPTPAQIAAATTPDELRALWESSSKSPEMSALVKARKAEMDGGAV